MHTNFMASQSIKKLRYGKAKESTKNPGIGSCGRWFTNRQSTQIAANYLQVKLLRPYLRSSRTRPNHEMKPKEKRLFKRPKRLPYYQDRFTYRPLLSGAFPYPGCLPWPNLSRIQFTPISSAPYSQPKRQHYDKTMGCWRLSGPDERTPANLQLWFAERAALVAGLPDLLRRPSDPL